MRTLLRELTDGSFPMLSDWASWHRTGAVPPGLRDLAGKGIETDA